MFAEVRSGTKRPCTISGRDRFERGKRLHGSAGASHSRDRENPFSARAKSKNCVRFSGTSWRSEGPVRNSGPYSFWRSTMVLALCGSSVIQTASPRFGI